MWLIKFMERSVIKGYDILLTGDKKILTYDTDKTNIEGVSESNLLNKTDYNELILTQ